MKNDDIINRFLIPHYKDKGFHTGKRSSKLLYKGSERNATNRIRIKSNVIRYEEKFHGRWLGGKKC